MNFAVALVALSRNVQRSDKTHTHSGCHNIASYLRTDGAETREGRPAVLLPQAREVIFTTITVVAGAGLEVDGVQFSTRPSFFSLRRHAVSLSDAPPAAKPRNE